MNKSSLAYVALGILVAIVLSRFIAADIALFAGFIIAVAGLVYSDRRKVKLEGVVLIRRTQRGKGFIENISRWGGWRKLSYVGIVIGVFLMIFGTVLLAVQAGAVIGGSKEEGVKLLLPGPVSTPVNAPGVFVVPWWVWVIGIAFVIIPHEFMHGIMCRIDKVRIKSVGWLLLILIPGAFVEPDEKQLEKKSKRTKLSVYAAGSFANMLVAGIFLLIIFLVSFSLAASSTISQNGVFVSTLPGGPAYNASLNGSITAINGIAVKNYTAFAGEMAKYQPGDVVRVATVDTYSVYGVLPTAITGENTHSYNVTLGQNPDREGAFLGVSPIAQAVALNMNLGVYATLSILLYWIFLFSFGIGLFNLLPIKPLDGGLIIETIAGKKIAKIVSVAVLLLLIFNILGPFLLN